jgi:hypothetical protein
LQLLFFLLTETPRFRSKPITIIVGNGPDMAAFYPNRDMLLEACPSFYSKMKMLGGHRGSSGCGWVLPDQSPKVFEMFLVWICDGEILGLPTLGKGGRDIEVVHILIDLYILANGFRIGGLQNSVIKELRRRQIEEGLVHYNVLNRVYEGTPKGSALRRFFVDALGTAKSENFLR